ncbi:MAG: DHH family phosphoesterase [Minisyncoccia bacterium]
MNKLKKFLERLEKDIKNSKNILIASHIEPDIDCLTSQLALYYILKSKFKDKKFFLYNRDFKNQSREISKDFKLIKNKLPSKFDLIIGIEPSSIERLGLNNIDSKIYIIDHHKYLDKNYSENFYIDENAESCAEIVYEIGKIFRYKIDKKFRKIILIGILGDSGWLRYTKNKKTLKLLSELYDKDISLRKLYKNIFGLNIKEFFALNKILKSGLVLKNKKMFLGFINRKDIKNNETLRKMIYFLTMLKDLKIFIFIEKIDKDNFCFHLRSDEIDVGKIAKKFGGGGHKFSSGFKIKI